jgi:hypothetical protein
MSDLLSNFFHCSLDPDKRIRFRISSASHVGIFRIISPSLRTTDKIHKIHRNRPQIIVLSWNHSQTTFSHMFSTSANRVASFVSGETTTFFRTFFTGPSLGLLLANISMEQKILPGIHRRRQPGYDWCSTYRRIK